MTDSNDTANSSAEDRVQHDHELERAKSAALRKQANLYAKWAATFSATVGVVAIIANSYSLASFSSSDLFSSRPGIEIQFLHDIDALKTGNKSLAQSLSKLDSQLSAISTPDTKTETARQIAALSDRLKNIDERLAAIDAVIIENPTKALSIPLLRQDLDNVKDDYEADRAAVSKEIDRIYDQNKWFIGLMFTMAFGIISLALSSFLQSKKTESE